MLDQKSEPDRFSGSHPVRRMHQQLGFDLIGFDAAAICQHSQRREEKGNKPNDKESRHPGNSQHGWAANEREGMDSRRFCEAALATGRSCREAKLTSGKGRLQNAKNRQQLIAVSGFSRELLGCGGRI